jgi:hypothetical protein
MAKISVPPEQRVPFFVYIIESPSAPDMYHRRFEGDMLQKALALDVILSAHRIAVSKEAFYAAVQVGLGQEMMQWYKDQVPIIHISAHGSQQGLQLTDTTIIPWVELKQLLLPLNEALKGNLILCMSSCEGAAACQMAMTQEEKEAYPFFGVVGHSKTPTWSDTAVGYAAFYHLIKKGYYLIDAVKGMCEASGDDGFSLIRASDARKAFIDSIKNQPLAANLQNALQQQNVSQPPSPEATKLEITKRP